MKSVRLSAQKDAIMLINWANIREGPISEEEEEDPFEDRMLGSYKENLIVSTSSSKINESLEAI